MIDALIRTFVRAPVLALIVCGALLGWGWSAFEKNPKDAIPDIAENQTIVFTEWMGRSPKDVDEQVTYPLTVALQSVPRVKEIRATSGFGWSIVYVVFHDNVDFDWARTRVLERLNIAQGDLPAGVAPTLGPDATALGQVFWYTVENGWYSPERPGLRFEEDGTLTHSSRKALLEADPSLEDQLARAKPYTCPMTGEDLIFSRRPLDRLRSIQDFDVKLALEGVEGVSEVASIGGYVRQYQIDVDPDALRAFNVSLDALVSSVRSSNVDVGAKVVEQAGMEMLVRGVGFLGGGQRSKGSRSEREQAAIKDIENIVVKSTDGTPIYVRQLAHVTTGADFRRGALDKMGAEAVGGSVIMRFGENPLAVIERVKEKIAAIESGLPPGVRINAFYDRTELIHETMGTLTTALTQELIITVVVVLLFLLHFRSSLVIAVTLPLAVLFAFICMQVLQLTSNIMSLAGIAIAIGTMVDMGIVMTENIYQHLSDRRDQYTRVETDGNGVQRERVDAEVRTKVVLEAAGEVAPAILTAISTTVISFVPVFFLEGQSVKLFAPLAWTKTFCLVGAVLLAMVVVPPFASLMLRGRVRRIDENLVSRWIRSVYEPVLRAILRHKLTFLAVPAFIVVWGLVIWLGLAGVLNVVIVPLSWVGLHLRNVSEALWIHLVFGLFIGLAVLPLVVDTVWLLVRRRRIGRQLHWLKRGACVVVGLIIAVGLHVVDAAPRYTASLSAVWLDKSGIGQEFMPPLDEGDFLYMPSVLPAGSLNTTLEIMQKQDVQFAQIPEVETVVGKLGRIESALDPAPVGMLETVIALKPRDQWPVIDDPDHPGRRRKRTMNEIWGEIQAAGRFPGVLPSVQLQPIRTRIEMLSTGFSAKIGLKIYGDDLQTCELLAVAIEKLHRAELTGAEAVNAVRVSGKPYLEFHIDREAIARYGVNIRDVQNVIEVAIGGMNLTTTYEGLDRYPVRVRYARELRDDIESLKRVLISTPTGAQIPITQVADLQLTVGPMSVKREGAKYVSYVTMSNVGVDETTLVRNGQAMIDRAIINGTLTIPEGYHIKWAGSYERNVRANKRLLLLIPLVLLINFVLIYLQFKRLSLTFVVFLAIPVAFAGGFILLDYWPRIHDALYLAGWMDRGFEGDAMYLTVAVWVGFIALFGIAVDDGIVLGTYLNQTFGRSKITRYEEIEERVVEAGLRRIRPCLMTSFTTLAALVPVMLSTGRGAEVMVPMAVPVFGGMLVVLVSLFVVPTCYCGIKQLKWRWGLPDVDFARQGTSHRNS